MLSTLPRAALAAAVLVALAADCGGTKATAASDPYPACLSSYERSVVELINADRADSGRSPLAVDTRLVQAARHTAQQRAAGNATFFDFGSYGDPGDAGTVGIGPMTPAEFWSLVRTQPIQEPARAAALAATSTHLGVGEVESSPGVNAYVAFVVGSSTQPAVVASCTP